MRHQDGDNAGHDCHYSSDEPFSSAGTAFKGLQATLQSFIEVLVEDAGGFFVDVRQLCHVGRPLGGLGRLAFDASEKSCAGVQFGLEFFDQRDRFLQDLCSAPGSVGETLSPQLGDARSVVQDCAVRETSDRACGPEAGCGQEEGEHGQRHAIDPRRMRMLTKCYERIHRKAEKNRPQTASPAAGSAVLLQVCRIAVLAEITTDSAGEACWSIDTKMLPWLPIPGQSPGRC